MMCFLMTVRFEVFSSSTLKFIYHDLLKMTSFHNHLPTLSSSFKRLVLQSSTTHPRARNFPLTGSHRWAGCRLPVSLPGPQLVKGHAGFIVFTAGGLTESRGQQHQHTSSLDQLTTNPQLIAHRASLQP